MLQLRQNDKITTANGQLMLNQTGAQWWAGGGIGGMEGGFRGTLSHFMS
jgi:hypothetical protein